MRKRNNWILLGISFLLGAVFSLKLLKFLYGSRIYSDYGWRWATPGFHQFGSSHPIREFLATGYDTIIFGSTLYFLFCGVGWVLQNVIGWNQVTARRKLVGLFAFPVFFVFGLASLLGYNMMVHTQSVFVGAASLGNITCMRITYALGADLNAPGCQYRSCYPPLIAAVYGRDIEAVQFLLDRGADVDIEMEGTTALMAAAAGGNGDIVRLLISHGADVNLDRDEHVDFGTALTMARRLRHEKVVELLKQAGAIETP